MITRLDNGQIVVERQTQAERSEQAISALRKSALALILESGYSRLTLGAVGARAGYSRGIVHYHFGTKEDLLADLLDQSGKIGQVTFQNLSLVGFDALDHLVAGAERWIAKAPVQALGLCLLFNEASASMSPEIRAHAARYNLTVRRAVKKALTESEAELFRATALTPAEAAELFVAVIWGLVQQWLAERDEFDLAKALGGLRKFIDRLRTPPLPAAQRKDDTSFTSPFIGV